MALNDSHGTGYAAHREDILLAKKTEENAILIASMVEDVKGRGGSGYIVGKDKQVLESRFFFICNDNTDIANNDRV